MPKVAKIAKLQPEISLYFFPLCFKGFLISAILAGNLTMAVTPFLVPALARFCTRAMPVSRWR
jgi:hypothetical protein